jgi:hypothetical protein
MKHCIEREGGTMAVRTLEFPTQRTVPKVETTVLDAMMPRWDATRVERCEVRAPLGIVFDRVLHLDFLEVPRRHFAVRALFAVRTLVERAFCVLTMRKFPQPSVPPTMRLKDMPHVGEWVRLGSSVPFEFAFGAIGRFWSGETKWLDTNNEVFRSFEIPGYARIGCHFLLAPRGNGTTVLTYEARTQATDPESRRAFLRYWWIVSIFVGIIMRATLKQIREEAEWAL